MNTTQHDCKTELRSVALKATPARLAILQLLEQTQQPLDIAAIILYLENNDYTVDEATVFRIINMFTQKGITKQLQFNEGKFRYELASKDDHHHLICDSCGAIEDIIDCGVATLEKTITKKKGFTVKRHSLEFFGVCQSCQR